MTSRRDPPTAERPGPTEWHRKRRDAFSRDEYTCQKCGVDVFKTGAEVHHVTPVSEGGSNSLDNLETLCISCHRDEHRTTPDDVLDAFSGREDRAEPLTAPELADVLNCSRRTALNKLNTLAERDAIASKKVGGRSKVWWRPIYRNEFDDAE